ERLDDAISSDAVAPPERQDGVARGDADPLVHRLPVDGGQHPLQRDGGVLRLDVDPGGRAVGRRGGGDEGEGRGEREGEALHGSNLCSRGPRATYQNLSRTWDCAVRIRFGCISARAEFAATNRATGA